MITNASPIILFLLPCVVNTCEYKHLDSLELADRHSYDLKKSIDVHVGSDYYWSIVTVTVSIVTTIGAF